MPRLPRGRHPMPERVSSQTGPPISQRKLMCAAVTAFAALCVLCIPQTHAQPAKTRYASVTCPALPVEVAAEAPDERSLACAAAGEALAMLGRCEIAPRRPLRLEIAGTVRNPFGREIFGRLDLQSEVVFITHHS